MISMGWMTHVAPMPDRPPFMNGFTAFHVELSARDMLFGCVLLGGGGGVCAGRVNEYSGNEAPKRCAVPSAAKFVN
jgi:hypothetical protein